MASVFEKRTADCQEKLQSVGADATILFPSPNLFYTSGFYTEPWDRHFFLIIPASGAPQFVIPGMFHSQVQEQSWVSEIIVWEDESGPEEAIQEAKTNLGLGGGHILLDDQMWEVFSQDIRFTFPDSTFGLAGEVFENLRMRKDDSELNAIRRASDIADEVSEEIRSLADDGIGMTERDLAKEIEDRMVEHGAEGLAFDISASSGPNTANVFHFHTDRQISKGDPVLLDFGAKVDNYCSDQCRMVVFGGDPPDNFVDAHQAVSEALEAGVSAVEPGTKAESVEEASDAVLNDHGFPGTTHRTGHGVGLTPHERPDIIKGNDLKLEPGMVFSVEPGLYFEGEFGVRIEDLVVVTEDGRERLNNSNRDWRPL